MAQQFKMPPWHDWPPAFTVQRAAATQQKQLQLWSQLVCDYCRAYNLQALELNDPNSPLFANSRIQRRLTKEGLDLLANHLIGQGMAAWAPNSNARLLIYWRRPEEWASMLHRWVVEQGRDGQVFTLFELREGEFGGRVGAEFRSIDMDLLLQALRHLESQGKARVMRNAAGAEEGVKFVR
eukprot:tig00000691_g3183.t1